MPQIERRDFTYQVATGTDIAGNPRVPARALAIQLFKDLVSFGFQVVSRNGVAADMSDVTKIVLQPSTGIDPLWNDNKWVVFFEIKGTAFETNAQGQRYETEARGLYFGIGTPSQIVNVDTVDAGVKSFPFIPPQFDVINSGQEFLGVNYEFPRISVRHPMSYQITVVERGFVIAAWTQGVTEDMSKMGIICVQRGVGCDGQMVTTGQRPLYMVTNITPVGPSFSYGEFYNRAGPRNSWYYSIIREYDTSVASPAWTSYDPAGEGYPKSQYGLFYNTNLISDPNEVLGQTLNYFPVRWYTPVTTDTGEYILIFPFGLCTSRFAFSDEIDLIAVSKADAYQAKQDVPITVYGEDRYYRAFNSNNQSNSINYDSGVRVFILVDSPELQ